MPQRLNQRRSDTASRMVHASSDTIYRAFLNADSLMEWLPPSGMSGQALEYDFRQGGGYRIELRYEGEMSTGSGKTTDRTDITTGHFLELVPDRRITQSVAFESSDPAFTGEMTMTWSFELRPEGTMVTVTADNVPSAISATDHEAGLRGSLDSLAAFVERGTSQP